LLQADRRRAAGLNLETEAKIEWMFSVLNNRRLRAVPRTAMGVAPLLAAGLLTALVVASFNPGCMNADSLDQWSQANTHQYSDWHPPMVAILWAGLRLIYPGIQSMLVFQNLAFSLGLFLMLRAFIPSLKLNLLLMALITLHAAVFVYLGSLIKDSLMSALLVLSVGLLFEYTRSRRSFVFWLCLASCYLTFAVRHNGVLAVLFPIALLFWARLGPWEMPVARRVAVTAAGLGFMLVAFAGASSLVESIFKVRHEYSYQALLLYDLSALSAGTGKLLMPARFVAPDASLPEIRAALTPTWADTLFWGPKRLLLFSASGDEVHGLLGAWFRAVLENPGLYLHWRWAVFRVLLGLGQDVAQPYVEGGIPENSMHIQMSHTALNREVMSALGEVRNSLFFRPWLYVLILAMFCIAGAFHRRTDLTLVAASGLIYFVAFLFITPGGPFRYACSTVILTVSLTPLVVREARWRNKSPQAQPSLRVSAVKRQTVDDIVFSSSASLLPSERLALYSIVFGLRPKRCLEIRTHKGESASIIAAAMDAVGEGTLVSVSDNPLIAPEHRARMSHRVTVIHRSGHRELPGLKKLGPFDFAFVAGDHSGEDAAQVLEGVLALMSRPAYLMVHNSHHLTVSRAVEDVLTRHPEMTDCGILTTEKAAEPDGGAACGGMRLLRLR
jgi:predicted O-methyltransferase YrrM